MRALHQNAHVHAEASMSAWRVQVRDSICVQDGREDGRMPDLLAHLALCGQGDGHRVHDRSWPERQCGPAGKASFRVQDNASHE